jgi:hypothetical protein
MKRFVKRHESRIIGMIAGFDRVLFRGTLRSICYPEGLNRFLCRQGVLLKDFGKFSLKLSRQVKVQAQTIAEQEGRPFIYVASAKQSKEKLAQQIMERDGVQEGLICVLECVEPCPSFSVRGDHQTKRLKLVAEQRKCAHFYFYYRHREFGFMHVRLQSWLPLSIQVCLNGREYLAKQMHKAGVGFVQAENCFTQIDNFAKAQLLLDRLLCLNWKRCLDPLGRRVNPWLDPKGEVVFWRYYWTIRESEFATDIIFKDPESLAEIYPTLVNHAIQGMSCKDVLRFLGRRINCRFNGAVTVNLRERPEGVRVKHWVEENSIKMYDKMGSVLRVETTINNPGRLRIRRRASRKGKTLMQWLPMRKSIADTRRRAEIGRAANERYLEALAVVGAPKPSCQLFDQVSKPVQSTGRSFRALRPISPEDSQLFQIIMSGEFQFQGVRNRDLRAQLFPDLEPDPIVCRQQSSRITRSLRLLREHKLIFKVPKTNYYRITNQGHQLMATALKFRQTDLALLAA